MVLLNALCAVNLASSVLVNGVCCYYQMKEEKERRKVHHESILRAVREEWNSGQMAEKEKELRDCELEERAIDLQGERRQQLMRQKIIAISGDNFIEHPRERSSPTTVLDCSFQQAPTYGKLNQPGDASIHSTPLPEINRLTESAAFFRSSSHAVDKASLSSLFDESDDEALDYMEEIRLQ